MWTGQLEQFLDQPIGPIFFFSLVDAKRRVFHATGAILYSYLTGGGRSWRDGGNERNICSGNSW